MATKTPMFIAADPNTRPKRTGPGGKTINLEAALALYELVSNGSDATDGKSYEDDKVARSASQSAARLLKHALSYKYLDNDYVAATRVYPDDGGWVWRVFLKTAPEPIVEE
jgi:hypothetical protein